MRSVFVNSPPPKPEVILTNFFAEPTVLLVPITSRASAIMGDSPTYQHGIGSSQIDYIFARSENLVTKPNYL